MTAHFFKIIVLAVLTAISHGAFAQIKFTYDNAGNRIKREYNGALVQLNVKVFLKGGYRTGQANMGNNLQTYFSANSGLLPVTDPYGGGVVYNTIGNPAGVAGAVVDWVKVEIRDASNPVVVVQSKSLLLKTNGDVVDTDGTLPEFVAQNGAVAIAIMHRNHVAIMSNAVAAFNSGTVSYDFTTALNKASQKPNDAPQMASLNGKWHMWSGDVNADLAVDGLDVNKASNDFNAGLFDLYFNTDVNLDGVMDGTDMSAMTNAFIGGYFSTLLNYMIQ
ncbi:hypothetical protein [Dyadobacter sp. MSC1_007]|jgi:hypothetical protein|uniref:hypothetical protein n=1 Tax=Dyadobacter sp. MSC1_007 TaxID=2909264 RepID=UPI00202E949F|nr:hypothetical protein [Dyadobacter sp. MSC1_007]